MSVFEEQGAFKDLYRIPLTLYLVGSSEIPGQLVCWRIKCNFNSVCCCSYMPKGGFTMNSICHKHWAPWLLTILILKYEQAFFTTHWRIQKTFKCVANSRPLSDGAFFSVWFRATLFAQGMDFTVVDMGTLFTMLSLNVTCSNKYCLLKLWYVSQGPWKLLFESIQSLVAYKDILQWSVYPKYMDLHENICSSGVL